MRKLAGAVFILILVGSAAPVSAASKKKAHGEFDDLFGAVDSASAPRHQKKAHARHARSRHVSKAKPQPRAERETRVASAEVPESQPTANADQLVLSDYAPGRHAWVGP